MLCVLLAGTHDASVSAFYDSVCVGHTMPAPLYPCVVAVVVSPVRYAGTLSGEFSGDDTYLLASGFCACCR